MAWLIFVLALAVSVRIVSWSPDAKLMLWTGRKLTFFGMSGGLGCIFGGAWSLVLGYEYAGVLLLIGIDLLLLTNQRSPFRGGK